MGGSFPPNQEDYFMDNETLQLIEKHMEGTNSGLAALAEVMVSMETSRISKEQEQEDYELQLEADEERTDLVKEIAGEVFNVLKAMGEGIGVGDSKSTNNAETGNLRGSKDADDNAKTISEDTSTATAGRPTESPTGNQLDGDTPGGSQLNTTSMSKEHSRFEEEEEEDEDEDVRKELRTLKADIAKAVDAQVTQRLSKSGFQEANSLKAARMIDLGAEAPILAKGATIDSTEDLLDVLVKMPDKEVRRLEAKVFSGDYAGVPVELLKAFGVQA